MQSQISIWKLYGKTNLWVPRRRRATSASPEDENYEEEDMNVNINDLFNPEILISPLHAQSHDLSTIVEEESELEGDTRPSCSRHFKDQPFQAPACISSAQDLAFAPESHPWWLGRCPTNF